MGKQSIAAFNEDVDTNWNEIRAELSRSNPNYCAYMDDDQCKAKIRLAIETNFMHVAVHAPHSIPPYDIVQPGAPSSQWQTTVRYGCMPRAGRGAEARACRRPCPSSSSSSWSGRSTSPTAR